ncbi:glycosyltransferase [bacterium]|nr:glycosyltransferase [bacterium]
MNQFSNKKLHIVAFDIPFPPDYGGVIDVFYKIKALHKLGVKITLHCWQYGGRKEQAELHKYCEKVHYYRRNRFMNPFSGPLPYIVKTRVSDELVANLNADNAPVLFEGLHTTAPLFFDQLPKRFTIIRNHNIESDYYRLLSEKENRPFKRTYLRQEARLLAQYEAILEKANVVAAISETDHEALKGRCNSLYVPAFHSNEKVDIIAGSGSYCLYHGNLAVAENDESALYLVREVFSKTEAKLVIAGNKASKQLREACAEKPNVDLLEHLPVARFDELIQHAGLNVLPTFQPTGIKLKLLNALYKGRFCVANEAMIGNSGLSELCHVANTAAEFVDKIEMLLGKPFTEKDIANREEVLVEKFSNTCSAQLLVDQLP